jgi:hypothetical protein
MGGVVRARILLGAGLALVVLTAVVLLVLRPGGGSAPVAGGASTGRASGTPSTSVSPPRASPTPRATPGPTNTVHRTGCVADPGGCGFPDASTTGPRPGTALNRYTGPTKIVTAGTVIQNVTLGCLEIDAANVTIRNAVIECDNSSYAVLTGAVANTTGVTTVDHVRLVCTGHGGTAFGDHRMAISFVDISHCENGGDADMNFSITESYIHDMFKGDSVIPEPHTDGIQVWPGAPNIVFSRNTVLVHDDNSAFTAGPPGGGPVAQLTIDDNLFDGGSYTAYCSSNAGSLSGNRFGPIGPNHTAPWGHTDSCATMTRTGNIEDATNQPISLSNLD